MRPIDADALIDEIKHISGQDTIMWFDRRKIHREQEVNMERSEDPSHPFADSVMMGQGNDD